MKIKQSIVYGFLAVILTFALAFTACSKSGGGGAGSSGSSGGGGGKSLNSAAELKEYLDKQPANSPDNPIKVAMKVNDMMIKDIVEVLNNAGKYVSLDLSGSPLTEIPGAAFRFCKTLVGIIIPDSVTSIGHEAFRNCTNLTNITIPNSVTNIGMAFIDCVSLTGVTIPNSVTSIWGTAFFGCTGLTSVTIPNSVTSIGESAFDCENLTSVTFQGTISSSNFGGRNGLSPFNGDLRNKYLAGGIGTYTTTAPVKWESIWTKQ